MPAPDGAALAWKLGNVLDTVGRGDGHTDSICEKIALPILADVRRFLG